MRPTVICTLWFQDSSDEEASDGELEPEAEAEEEPEEAMSEDEPEEEAVEGEGLMPRFLFIRATSSVQCYDLAVEFHIP